MVALGLRCWLLVAVLDSCFWGVVVVGMVANGGDIDNKNLVLGRESGFVVAELVSWLGKLELEWS